MFLIASIAVALLCSPTVNASLYPSLHATHGHQRGAKGTLITTFHPKSTFQTFGVGGLHHAGTKRADVSPEDAAVELLVSRLPISHDAVLVRSSHRSTTGHHVYVQQKHRGIAFANAVGSVSFNHRNHVEAISSSFVQLAHIASDTPGLSERQAISAAEAALQGRWTGFTPTLEYVVKEDNTAALTYVVRIHPDKTSFIWSELFIDAHSGELVSITDTLTQATFRALTVTKHDAYDGIDTIVNPEDLVASPYGWLSVDNKTQATNTSGNNAFAYIAGVPAPQSVPGTFGWKYDTSLKDVASTEQKNAAIVNAFYVANSVHDVTYRYGFTEAAYNFQQVNIRGQGKGNDRLNISVLDPAGQSNAQFWAAPDGELAFDCEPGLVQIYPWGPYTNPVNNMALENDLVIHELGHGVSQRLDEFLGGGTTRCLQTLEAGGLGEGWSDALANWFNQNSSIVHDFAFGGRYSAFMLREFPYSVDTKKNPQNYSWGGKPGSAEVHTLGEAWAEVLHVVYASLVKLYGWDATARTNPASAAGNAVFLHLFIDSFSLLPCNPTFMNARDSWIQADANRYGGVNKCLLWTSFASRGWGTGAANYTDSFAVPSGC